MLDGALAAAARGNGDSFADVRGRFSGHELCDADSWMNGIVSPLGDSYHPTADGQQDGYLPAFTAAVRHDRERSQLLLQGGLKQLDDTIPAIGN